MADTSYLFIGPYAEWLIPAESFGSSAKLNFIHPEPRRRALVWNVDTNDNNNLTVVVQRRRLYRFCGMPCTKRTGQPKREMLLSWDFTYRDTPPFIADDWSAIDRQAEVVWFRAAFATEVQRAAERIGSEPTFCWGLVHWCID